VSYFSIFIGVALFILLFENPLKGHQTTFRYILIAFFATLLYLLQGKMNILAFVVVIPLVLLLFKHREKSSFSPLWAFVFTIASIGAFIIATKDCNPARFSKAETRIDTQIEYSQISDDSKDSKRIATWSNVVRVIKENFWLGVGIGDGKDRLVEEYRSTGYTYGFEKRYGAHNIILQEWLMNGVIGAVVLLSLFGSLLLRAYRNRDKLLFSSALFFFLCGMTESLLDRSKGLIFFTFFLGWLYVTSVADKPITEHKRS
jgi:O-antigen ligase